MNCDRDLRNSKRISSAVSILCITKRYKCSLLAPYNTDEGVSLLMRMQVMMQLCDKV